MLAITHNTRVFLALEGCDMRKSFNGLYALAQGVIEEDPRNGAVFAFSNRSRTRLKMLYWDGTGLWVMSKRLEKGTFSWPKSNEIHNKKMRISMQTMNLIAEGIDLRGGNLRPWYERE